MGDDYPAGEAGMRSSEPADPVEGATRKLSTALIIAGALIAAAIYARPGPPHYQALAAPNGDIVRVNLKNGAMIACRGQTCFTIVRQGQHLAKQPPALPAPATAAPSAPPPLPAPAPPG